MGFSVTVLGLVGGAWGETPRVAVIRRRARAAFFITAYLLLGRAASATPHEQCTTFARSGDFADLNLVQIELVD